MKAKILMYFNIFLYLFELKKDTLISFLLNLLNFSVKDGIKGIVNHGTMNPMNPRYLSQHCTFNFDA